eukprot:2125300-Rhodomonas_salina.1
MDSLLSSKRAQYHAYAATKYERCPAPGGAGATREEYETTTDDCRTQIHPLLDQSVEHFCAGGLARDNGDAASRLL